MGDQTRCRYSSPEAILTIAPETSLRNFGAVASARSRTSLWDRGSLEMPAARLVIRAAMTFLRSYADDLPLQEWLEKQVFPKEALLTEEEFQMLSQALFDGVPYDELAKSYGISMWACRKRVPAIFALSQSSKKRKACT